MSIESILMVFTTVVTALGLQKAGPMLITAWARRTERRRAERAEAAKSSAAHAIEIERIDTSQLLEREKLVASREQNFHQLEMELRGELKRDRDEMKSELLGVRWELARQNGHFRRCQQDRKRLRREMKELREQLYTLVGPQSPGRRSDR